MGPRPSPMSSSSMKTPSSAANTALVVKPLLTAPDWSLLIGVAKAAGACVAACAKPTMAHAAASVATHSNKGSFRLVINEFLLDFLGTYLCSKNSAVCRRLKIVCQMWTDGKFHTPSACHIASAENWAQTYSSSGLRVNVKP